ncbi:inactive hydroxysteroid dehydrogenase-like protein 1 isoform X2 [Xenia sp. Carnegie-2017]|uniref:inactive hydroxysteroid dehydrogenase-like protein 1 isoform X2 n=1 Tax=Xenia sp. Carnegie-2017 TaxID=2897299 RepID=UPI001F034FB1|nr:inactive hydroxysteroid dehydrogenase-like protein 1 isoform X2 [Xenia sp. Carnegie-2017]
MNFVSNLDQQTIWFILDDITQYLGGYRNVLALIGTAFVIKKLSLFVFHFLKSLRIYFISKLFTRTNFKIIGGKWAVITGASDGIGKAFAYELANLKFNIVMLSRTESKLQDIASDLEKKFFIQTKVVAVDFSDDSIYEDIKVQINGLDIGILVNNVGTHHGFPSFFMDVPKKKLHELINVNMTSLTMMTQLILPGMVNRKRGAIINLSSSAAQYPTPLITVYSATKAYVEYFSQGLSIEYAKDNITIQCLQPFYVSTAMTYHVTPNIFVPTAESYARNALATLPYARKCCGHYSHGMVIKFLWRMVMA